MKTNELTVEQQERANQKRAAMKVLIGVIKMQNKVRPYSSHVAIDVNMDMDDLTLTGHDVANLISVAKIVGLSGYASGINQVRIF